MEGYYGWREGGARKSVAKEKSWESVPESNADDPEYTYTECLIKHSM